VTDRPEMLLQDQVRGEGGALTERTRRRSYSVAEEARTWRLLTLLVVTAVLWITFDQITHGVYFSARNITNLTVQTTILAVVAVGTNLVLIVREIDLASGSLISLTGVLAVYAQVHWSWNAAASIILAVTLGAAIGALHGGIIVFFRVPSFIMTLAGLMYLSGVAFIVSNGFVVSGASPGFNRIANYYISPRITLVVLGVILAALVARGIIRAARTSARRSLGLTMGLRPVRVLSWFGFAGAVGVLMWAYVSYDGLPALIAILGVIAAGAWYVGRHVRFGRHLYAIGGNREAARRAGIRVSAAIWVVFAVAGALAAVGGVLLASRLQAATPDMGSLIPLNAISACVVGGTSLFGGRGDVAGALLGALALQSILNGLSLEGVNTYYQYIAIAWILVMAVVSDAFVARRLQAGT
jgi:D-xylose transport system permease protein